MANKIWKDCTIKLDNASGTLTALTSYVNQANLQAAIEILEDTALSDSSRSIVHGIHSATIPLNGFVNTTTDGIFGPLIAGRTSVTKTVEFYNGTRYYNGECLPSDVQYSGAVNTLVTFSCTLEFDGAINRTSTGLA